MDLDFDSDDSLAVPHGLANDIPDLAQAPQVPQLVHDEDQGVRESTCCAENTLIIPGIAASLDPKSQMNVSPLASLYDIPLSNRFFWKEPVIEQLALRVVDKYPEQTTRPMPKHEILVMALNEIAVHHGYGFFFYLPSKDGQRKNPSQEHCPSSRLPLSAEYGLSFALDERSANSTLDQIFRTYTL